MTVLAVTLHPAIDKVLRVPRLRPNDNVRSVVELLHAGGKGNNAARALVRIGVPAVVTGFQGGCTGRFAAEQLTSDGVKTAFVECRAPTRTSTMIRETDTGVMYAIYEPGQPVEADEVERLLQTFEALVEDVRLCLLCGSGQTPVAESVFAQMIEIARRHDVRCLVDSSGQALTQAIRARPFMVKVNRQELSECVGYPLTDTDAQMRAMRDLCRQGINLVLLTLGADGMLAVDHATAWEGVLPMPSIINSVGCGDALLAGVTKALLDQLPLPEIVRWGVACGTANTQNVGAGYIDQNMVAAMLPRVQLRGLAL